MELLARGHLKIGLGTASAGPWRRNTRESPGYESGVGCIERGVAAVIQDNEIPESS